eukprot:Gb_00321 [translate_table: standard]
MADVHFDPWQLFATVRGQGWLISGFFHMEGYSITFFISAILFAIHKGNAINHNVDWAQVTANTDFSNNWTATSKFFVGDELVFRLNNDRDYIAQVSESAYLSCSADRPIAIYSDKTVIKLNRTGNWYFIHGSPRHCKFGEKLLIRVVLNVRAYTRAEIGYCEGKMVKIARGGGGRGGGRVRGRNLPKDSKFKCMPEFIRLPCSRICTNHKVKLLVMVIMRILHRALLSFIKSCIILYGCHIGGTLVKANAHYLEHCLPRKGKPYPS